MFPAPTHRFFLLFLLLFAFGSLRAQTEADIERLKKRAAQLSAKISDTDKKATLLRRQLNLSENRVALLNEKISETESLIDEQEKELQKLDTEREMLLKLAKQLLVYAYKTRNTRSKAAFLLSSDDFSQAYKRFLYVRFYTNVLNRKIDAVNKNQTRHLQKAAELSEKRNELYKLAEQKTDELLAHKQNIQELKRIKQQLRQNSSKIRKEISKKQKILDRLNTAISDEILVGHESNPESVDFKSAKGKLPFPMKGVITQKFGNHRHEVLENVTISSNGIELSGKLNSQVYAVFTGTVLRISDIPGSNLAVIIQHGNYYTVYSNLKQCSFTQGQKVAAGQKIGVCAESPGDASHSVLYFQLWLNKTKLDPEQWLKKT